MPSPISIADLAFERLPALGEEMPARIASPQDFRLGNPVAIRFRRSHRRRQHLLGQIQFAVVTVTSEILEGIAIEVAAGEIHRRKSRMLPQLRIDQADTFKELWPVRLSDSAQAGDDVSNRDVRGALTLLCMPDRQVDIRPLLGQPILQPADGRCCDRVAIT